MPLSLILSALRKLQISGFTTFPQGIKSTYLGMVALAKVQQRSVHMTDIQQNMEIPA